MARKIFLHHQRCGGTTLHKAYKTHAFPYRPGTMVKVKDAHMHHPDGVVFEIEPGVYISELGDEYDYFTVLREPVERVLSLLELHSRPNTAVNIVGAKSYEYRNTGEFWKTVIAHMEMGGGSALYHNTYTVSLSGHKGPPSDENIEMAFNRIRGMPVLIFNKATYADDLTVFGRHVGLGNGDPTVGHHGYALPDSEIAAFRASVPTRIKDYIISKNEHDIRMYNMICGLAGANNIYMGS